MEKVSSWRPKDWENPYDEIIMIGEEKNFPVHVKGMHKTDELIKAYEVGADAMLEELMKLAKESPTGTFCIDSKSINIYEIEKDNKKGKLKPERRRIEDGKIHYTDGQGRVIMVDPI